MNERQTKMSIIALARKNGCEQKVISLIQKYEDLVKGARSNEERKYIASLGIAEIYKTIGCVGGLVVDGQELIPPDTSYKEEINLTRRVVKLD